MKAQNRFFNFLRLALIVITLQSISSIAFAQVEDGDPSDCCSDGSTGNGFDSGYVEAFPGEDFQMAKQKVDVIGHVIKEFYDGVREGDPDLEFDVLQLSTGFRNEIASTVLQNPYYKSMSRNEKIKFALTFKADAKAYKALVDQIMLARGDLTIPAAFLNQAISNLVIAHSIMKDIVDNRPWNLSGSEALLASEAEFQMGLLRTEIIANISIYNGYMSHIRNGR